MKITSKTLMVAFEHTVTVGNNDAIEATLLHQAFISEGVDGGVHVDLDFCEITDVNFLRTPVEGGYQRSKKFKATMKELGVDVEKLFDDKAAQLITDQDMFKLKSLFKTLP